MADFRLDRITSGELTPRLQKLLNKAFEKIEAAYDDLTTKQATLEATQRRLNIGLSWTAPSNVLTATDAGSNATITVAAHTRVYASGAQSSIPGTSFTGLAYSTNYAIYYDDPTLGNPTPTYQITTNIKTAQHNYVEGRIMVGSVQTPAAAAPPVTGGNVPPGYDGLAFP